MVDDLLVSNSLDLIIELVKQEDYDSIVLLLEDVANRQWGNKVLIKFLSDE